VRAEPFTPVTVARILRPWGRRGEVAAEILTDFPQRLTATREVWLAREQNAPRRVAVLSCRIHLGQAVFHFEGIDTISDAETLRGLEVQLPLECRLPLAPGRYYITDLVGCQVWQPDSAAPLGVVEDVQASTAPQDCAHPESWLLVVNAAGRELLIPLAVEICTRIDTAAKRIDVRLPPGLLDLND
jgi:16S rRNA processing protein RimM